ncbi:hypothetical protein DGWBC_0634 [Dehalogenimonas sp. WBC-2]|nr:hypothetical protein DGWBC_0634 [Dehalogenimonas sp. WBC-2]
MVNSEFNGFIEHTFHTASAGIVLPRFRGAGNTIPFPMARESAPLIELSF